MLYAPYEPPLCVAHNSGPSSKARARAGAFYGSCGCGLTRVNGGAPGKLGKWRCKQAKSASVLRQGERRSAWTRQRIGAEKSGTAAGTMASAPWRGRQRAGSESESRSQPRRTRPFSLDERHSPNVWGRLTVLENL